MRSFENHGWKLSARKISSNVQNPIFRRETQITPNLPNISRRHNIPTRTQHYLIITSPKQPIHNTIIIISNPLNRHVTTSKLTSVETPNPPETPPRAILRHPRRQTPRDGLTDLKLPTERKIFMVTAT